MSNSDVRNLDVVTVGHALVDVFAPIEDDFLIKEELIKGSMNLIGDERAAELYGHMGPASESSGGSAANTATGVVACGGTAAFVGTVGDDELGEIFIHDLRAAGVHYETDPIQHGQTGRSLILITPDSQRTMNTNIACSNMVGMHDLKAELLRTASITYVEGYLFDDGHPFEGWTDSIKTIHDANNRFSITLSDSFCVERHRDLFMHLLDGSVDICFGNEDEFRSLFEVEDLEHAINEIEKRCEVAAITRGAQGSILCANGKRVEVPAHSVTVVDTTGAGDLYAAGVLTGLAQGRDLEVCGVLGSKAAGAVISRVGARVSSVD